MNEWKTLLQQTHPEHKPEVAPPIVSEEVVAAPVEAEEEAMDFDSALETAETVKKDLSTEEIEWISPVSSLTDKIENIPDKFGFKIGEAADYVGVKQYVLRYWETEFDVLKPKKSKNGQRMYTKKDVETACLIKKLLHEDRFSIEGARSALKRLKKQVKEKVSENQESAETKTSTLDSAQKILQAVSRSREILNL